MPARFLVTSIGVILLVVALFWGELLFVAEDIALQVSPSAERAYAFGSRHIDARHPNLYDLQRAEYFFRHADRIDPHLSWLQHQLARVAFLEGNFNEALIRINAEIQRHGNPSSYYVRGLIYGFMGEYGNAAADYRTYLKSDPTNWAATNDLAWVLLKDRRYDEALSAIDAVLAEWPTNPWLHNSRATALVELGRLEEARAAAQAANDAVRTITEEEWRNAYPGNDPLIAKEGVSALQSAIRENMHTIEIAQLAATKSVP